MQPDEKQLRMQRMRKSVRENNVYRWAGNLIGELCEVRLDHPETAGTPFGRALLSESGIRDVTPREY